ncbi:MAG: DUF362 domain-containing protein [Nitrospirota bacterium]
MNRREFLRFTVATGIGLTVPNTLDILSESASASKIPDLVVVEGASPSKITIAAIDAIGGMRRFISRGDIVVVKPNIGFDRTPEYAANTNPEVVSTVVRLCYEAGAKNVKVFDRTVNDARRCYVQSGIADASKKVGAEVSHIDDRKFSEIKINGQALKSWPLYTEILEADKVINIPVAKHHSLAKLTMAMKNWMGIMGGFRRQIHQRLDESLVDIATVIKPTLTILDAVRILIANGPQGGSLEDVKKIDTVIVGVDQVAVDSCGATLFGLKGSDLGYVRISAQSGLGEMDISKLTVKKFSV